MARSRLVVCVPLKLHLRYPADQRKLVTIWSILSPRVASLPVLFKTHSFRVGGSLSKSLAGAAVDDIMKIGG